MSHLFGIFLFILDSLFGSFAFILDPFIQMKLHHYNAELIRIIDGDTIDVMLDLGFYVWVKKRIRLYGIDTPETRTRDVEEKERGKAASVRLAELISSSKDLKDFN